MATTRQILEAKYGKPVTPTGPVQSMREKLTAKYSKPFTYDVPQISQPKLPTPEEKIAKYKAEQVGYDAEAKKQGSVLGMAKNFGKAFVENIAPSEVGLGKSIAKIFGNQSNVYNKQIQDTGAVQANLVKQIRDKEVRGEDTTKLKQLYNEGVTQLAGLQSKLKEESTMPTTGQVVGQLGGTALDIATAGTYGKAKTGLMATGKLAPNASTLATKATTLAGLPELGKVAGQKASGIFTKKGATNVLKGAGIGYGYDVSQGLQGLRGEDREGSSAFVPGLGTAIGAGIPLVQGSTQSVKNRLAPDYKVAKLEAKRLKELDKLTQAPLTKAVEKGRERGIDIKKVLSETDVLHGSVDKTGNITTKGSGGAIEEYTKKYIQGNEDIVSKALQKENKAISADLIKARLNKAIMDSGIEGKALTQARKNIEEELAGYALRGGANKTIPLETLHRAKIDKYNSINFFTEGNTKKYDKTVAKALKEIVEQETKSVDVKKINEELSKHFAVIDYLEKLNGKKVEGGKLGKYFAQTVGGIVGSHFGPLGAIAGAEAGGRLKGGAMSRAFRGKTGKTVPQAEAITQAIEYKKSAPLQLPQSKSNNLGNLKMSQSTTINPTMNGIDTLSNVPKKKSIIDKLTGKDLPNKQGGFIKIGKDTGINTSPANVAKKVDERDLDLIKRYLNNGSDKNVERVKPILEGMKIDKLDIENQDKFLREVVAEATSKPKVVLPQSQSKGKALSLPNNTTKPLIEEAKKYKSAEKFVKKNNPVEYSFDSYSNPLDRWGGPMKYIRVDLFPNALVKGKGITRSTMLDVLKEGYSKGFNQVTPSMGIWTSDGKAFMETLVRDGYIDKSYKVLDKIKKYKTKNALTDIWKQATSKPKVVLPQSQSKGKALSLPNNSTEKLVTEAKKYKSAEEFVSKQPVVYHGSAEPLKKFNNKQGTFFTDDYMMADGYAGGQNVYEGYLNLKKPLVIDAKGAKWDELKTPFGESTQEIAGKLDTKKYDGIIFKNIKDSWIDDVDYQDPSTIYYVAKTGDSFLNKSQLTDIWKQANQK